MKIRSIDQANRVGECCGCPYPECPAPDDECQSVTVFPCGYQVPDCEGVSDEDKCKIFRKRIDTRKTHITGSFDFGSYSEHQDSETTNTTTRERRSLPACTPVIVLSTYHVNDAHTFTPAEEEGEAPGAFTVISDSTFDITADPQCQGTQETTGEGGTGPDPWEFCFFADAGNIDCETWTVSGLSFSISSSETVGAITTTTDLSIEFAQEVGRAEMQEDLDRLIDSLGEDDWPGVECVSAYKTEKIYAEPEEEEPPPEEEEGEDDPPEEPDPEPVLICERPQSLTQARYRRVVPASFSTEDAPRSTYEIQWDEYFFPKEWEEWEAMRDAYRASLAAHEAWEACQLAPPDDGCGDEPALAPEPGEEPAKPTLVAERSWTWDGTEENNASPWYVLEIPEGESAGETRPVNTVVVCWRSSKVGTKPTWVGEIYVPEEEEEE